MKIILELESFEIWRYENFHDKMPSTKTLEFTTKINYTWFSNQFLLIYFILKNLCILKGMKYFYSLFLVYLIFKYYTELLKVYLFAWESFIWQITCITKIFIDWSHTYLKTGLISHYLFFIYLHFSSYFFHCLQNIFIDVGNFNNLFCFLNNIIS